MAVLVHPTYFPSISHFVAMVQSDQVIFEIDDNFQKQTNRNRMYIYSPNGIQLLNVPIKHAKNAFQKTKDVKIENDFNWQKQHFKSLEAAYRSSPFFEYFEDDIRPLFTKKHAFLMDLNLQTFALVSECLGTKFNVIHTAEYFKDVNDVKDYRTLANGKKNASLFDVYTQVFEEKAGFLNNLSVLDLLFNEGRYALDYLKNQQLNF